ncbi:MAG: shikimate kinase [Treponema sp.]|jgi:shikimate kinase|nr:shikimate kinase [Treponema sp.]
MEDIILTGPKHSGKTSAGKALALLCSCSFIDIDELILQRTGKSPRQLFNEGADIFQKAETEATEAIASAGTDDEQRRRIIAAGGGIIDNPDAVSVLKKSGATIVYLNISAASAWQRISAKGELPPFLKTENPQETHCSLHERRAAAYLQLANIVIEAEGKTSKKIAAEILQLL